LSFKIEFQEMLLSQPLVVLGHTALSNRPQYHAQTAIITRWVVLD